MDGSGDHSEMPSQSGSAITRVVRKISQNKVEATLWATRMATLFFCFNFLLPLLGFSYTSSYQKALLSNGATSALRLHQRLPRIQFTREFLANLLLEDSAHYLFYSLIFSSSHPITMVLSPVFLFALCHITSYTKQLLNEIGPDSLALVRKLIAKVEEHQRNILRLVACNEIFLMPVILLMTFSGSASLLLPFVYYRFLTLRYSSRRNPYNRQLFLELRMTIQDFVERPSCPAFLKTLTYKVIALICKLAPAYVQQ